jgi:16S rRNA (uracil1498-N3)-methyltransferase
MHTFYQADFNNTFLSEEEAAHCTKVLRLSEGELIHLVNGAGRRAKATLVQIQTRNVKFSIIEESQDQKRPYEIHMLISPTRKLERNEWMVEKMVEVGVDAIHFIKTEHSHRESFDRVTNLERLQKIAIAAMKQSNQSWLPSITNRLRFEDIINKWPEGERFIAYVANEEQNTHLVRLARTHTPTYVLIGPEGDFSVHEIQSAIGAGWRSVSLGSTRLRTETAAFVACHSVHLANL